MKRLAALLCLLCLIAWAPAKPKVKIAQSVRLAAASCPTTGNCVLILTWTRPQNYNAATDTGRVTWDQTAPTAFLGLRTGPVAGTADTLSITRPADGKTKSGTVTLCYTRTGWTGQACNGALAWSVTAPVPPPPVVPPDTATSVTVTPLTFSVRVGETRLLAATVTR